MRVDLLDLIKRNARIRKLADKAWLVVPGRIKERTVRKLNDTVIVCCAEIKEIRSARVMMPMSFRSVISLLSSTSSYGVRSITDSADATRRHLVPE